MIVLVKICDKCSCWLEISVLEQKGLSALTVEMELEEVLGKGMCKCKSKGLPS